MVKCISSVIDEVAPLQAEEDDVGLVFTRLVELEEVDAGVGSLNRNPAMTVVL